MKECDFPALYRSADTKSIISQRHFFRAIKLHLLVLVFAAIISVVNYPHWSVAMCQLFLLLGALLCSIYLFSMRPDRLWYDSRALAESIKTITWRYVCRAEPFSKDDPEARSDFYDVLKKILQQNRETCQFLNGHLSQPQITDTMNEIRIKSLEERRLIYADTRIKDQLAWYSNKAEFNRKKSNMFFIMLIVTNSIAVMFSVLHIVRVDLSWWPTDIFVTAAASLLSWMQAKRYSELTASYTLAAHEISIINEQALQPATEHEFSLFVSNAENAFSREHTQWIARKDM